MGVPKFFSWITKRYPLILQQTKQGSLPQIDYLYLDMNGIIYKCSKDESIIFKSMVKSKEMEEIWLSIFNYISNIVETIQPQKLLFLGLDGVAPRAKMNNQRSRRYNSAKSYAVMEQRLSDYGEKNEENFKNNCITPGTQFMFELNKRLRFFIQKKIQEDPQWQKFRVMFSGGDVPGEGEHKIMDFIREGINQKIFNEESKHCLYGADADLIMLAMTLQIKNLCIIREQFIFNKNSKAINISSTKNNIDVTFQLIYISILKEYFELQYLQYKELMKHEYNLQKIINDFVFLCFFIGNDFLPRCYCYDIRQGFLERLIEGFKEYLMNSETYLLGQENINLIELQRLTGILKKSQALFIASRQQELRDVKQLLLSNSDSQKQREVDNKIVQATLEQPMKNQKQFILTLKTLYLNDDLAGAKKHFYKQKFNLDTDANDKEITNIIETYLTGLNYVYQYYFKTLPSWEWFYPYYYAPLVNDLNVYLLYKNQNRIGLTPFTISEPFEPFKQLLCILPEQSYGLLPSCLQQLITSQKSLLRSPFDYFPREVKIDPYGGKSQHQFISILPFIDQQIVTQAYNSIDKKFTEAELLRNQHTLNELYIYDTKQPQTSVRSLYQFISDFKVPLAIHRLNFLQDKLSVVTEGIQNESAVIPDQGFTFPTLKIRQFTSCLVQNPKQYKNSLHLKLTLKPQEPEKPIKMGSIVYFGFPSQKSGKVLAICTKQQITTDAKDFDYYDFIKHDYKDGPTVKQIWDVFREEVVQQNQKRRGILLNQSKVLYFVMISNVNIRKRSGKYIRSFENPSYRIIPDCLLSSHRNYTFTKIPFVPASIQQQFALNEQVIILNKQFCGNSGRVVGYSQNNKKVRVQINKKLKKIPQQIIQKAKGNDFFWSLGFVARIFNVDLDTILILIDSLPINLDENDVSAKGMPYTIDIGLNYIKRNFKKLVPTLVRLPLDSQNVQQLNIYREFKKLQISTTALQLIYKYYLQYPEIFHFLNERCARIKQDRNQNWREEISVNDIWDSSDNSKKAIETYLWLIKQQQVHEPNSSINSTKISKSRITSLLNYFKSQKDQKYSQVQQFDPNFLYSAKLSKQGLLYLKNPPPNHRIGDRVICLQPQQFGQIAIIIGIDTTYQDLVFQVLFEKPSFGKDNLGGLVDYLWGGQYNYQQLFNIDSWTQDIEERGGNDKIGWDGSQPGFVNSTVFKNTNSNKRSEVIEKQNYHKILDKLQIEEGLVEFIKKAAQRNPGRGYQLVTKRDQRQINNLRVEEQVLLDYEKSKQPKVKYIEKEEAQQKSQKTENTQVQKPSQKNQEKAPQPIQQKATKHGQKVFKKHVFEDESKNNKKVTYVQKPSVQNPKQNNKPANVVHKPKYIQKKEEEKIVQKPEQKQSTQKKKSIDITALGVDENVPKKKPITAEELDNQIENYVNKHQSQKTAVATVPQVPAPQQNKQPILQIPKVQSQQTQTKPSITSQVPKDQNSTQNEETPKEQYDEDIFG